MAYEYSPNSSRFEIPNPHRIENIFLWICAVACVAVGIAMLFDGRSAYVAHNGVVLLKCVIIAVALLGSGFYYARLAMGQMRFYFGRGEPADLVPRLGPEQQGAGASPRPGRQLQNAAALRETMRQNAIVYPTPRGPFDSLLYSCVRNLIFSPSLTQNLMKRQFRSLLGLAFLLLCFIVSLAGIRNGAAVAWIGAFYFAMTAALVLRPLAGGSASRDLPQQAVIAFIVGSIIGPVVLATIVPSNAYPLKGTVDFEVATFLIVVTALIMTALIFKAAMATTVRPEQINLAPHLETPSVNATPAQIFTELAREMQRLWVEQVPNRTYMRELPDTSQARGSFTGNLIEETQPLAVDMRPVTLHSSATNPTTRWLLIVDLFGTLLAVIGTLLLASSASTGAGYANIIYGGAALIVAAFGIRNANLFWKRFEFKSRLYWIECNGNYTSATTKIGALLADRVHSERELVNVETMTLRAWVAELDSVAFDTSNDREMVSLRGLPNEAERICKLLAAFGENQPSVVAPTSIVDQERLAMLNRLNAIAAIPQMPEELGTLLTGGHAAVGATPAPPPTRTSAARFCTRCGASVPDTAAAFCGSCGAAIKGPD